MSVFDDASVLGKLILSVADTVELDAYIATCTPEQIKKIKSSSYLAPGNLNVNSLTSVPVLSGVQCLVKEVTLLNEEI
jgi:hypothetical protein